MCIIPWFVGEDARGKYHSHRTWLHGMVEHCKHWIIVTCQERVGPVSWFFARCMDAPKLFLVQVKRFYHLFYFWCLIAPPFCRCNQPGIGAAAYGSSILSCGRAHHWALAEQLLRHAEQETLVETWHGWSEAIHGLRGHVSTDRPRIWWMVLLSKIFLNVFQVVADFQHSSKHMYCRLFHSTSLHQFL